MCINEAFFVLQLAAQVSQTAAGVLDNATSVNITANELANNVSLTREGVDRLEQTVREDKETIAMATDTANETIIAVNNITQRIIVVQVRGGKKKELILEKTI